MTFRRPARVLAPLALLACAGAVFAVVTTSLNDDSSGSPATTSTSTTRARTTTTVSKRRTYVVKSGDTLGAISVRVGVPVDKLLQLNPKVDPQSLRAGQKLRLRE